MKEYLPSFIERIGLDYCIFVSCETAELPDVFQTSQGQ